MRKSIPVEKICKYCEKIYFVIPCHSDSKFCSHSCYSLNLKGEKRNPRSEQTKIKISIANSGERNGMYGKKAWNSDSKGLTKANSGSFKKGQISWNKGKGKFKQCECCKKKIWVENNLLKRKKFCSRKCFNLFQIGKDRPHTRGKNNWHWKGGTTPLRTTIWRSFKSRSWRLSIFERDKFTCQMPNCDKTETFLNAHHIKEFGKIIEKNNIKTLEEAIKCKELWDMKNGITLCKKCHHKTYGHEQQYAPLFQLIVNSKLI